MEAWPGKFFAGLFLLMSSKIGSVTPCPLNCICDQPDEDIFFNHYYVACESMGLSEIPPRLEHRTTELSLAGNRLKTLKDSNLESRLNIVALYLQGNHFQNIDIETVHVLSSLSDLRVIDLSDNPWDCSCTPAMQEFVRWLESTRGPQPSEGPRWIAMVNGYRATCVTPGELTGERLDRLTVGDIC